MIETLIVYVVIALLSYFLKFSEHTIMILVIMYLTYKVNQEKVMEIEIVERKDKDD